MIQCSWDQVEWMLLLFGRPAQARHCMHSLLLGLRAEGDEDEPIDEPRDIFLGSRSANNCFVPLPISQYVLVLFLSIFLAALSSNQLENLYVHLFTTFNSWYFSKYCFSSSSPAKTKFKISSYDLRFSLIFTQFRTLMGVSLPLARFRQKLPKEYENA